MKIAFASNDGSNISRHFGRSEFYVVVDAEDGKVLSRRLISKESSSVEGDHDDHCCGGHGHDHEHEHKHEHQHDHDDAKHKAIFDALENCQVVVAGGMGKGALNRLQTMQVQAILTQMKTVDEALAAYLEGRLVHMTNLAH